MATKDSEIPSFLLYGEGDSRRQLDDRMLHIETIAARGRFHNWKIRPHVHRNLHQLLFIMRGGGEERAEGTTAQFRSPAVIVIPAGTVHAFDFEPHTQGFVASIADDVLRECARGERGIRSLFDVPLTLQLSAAAVRATDLRSALQMFVREFTRLAPGRTAALEALLVLILANVLRLSHTFGNLAMTTAGRPQWLVAQFRELIENHYRENTTLIEYAVRLNVSTSQLRSACLKVTEQSPMRLVYARVLLEAKRQLLYSNMSISEIAYALGFDDAAYFTRFFTHRTGTSPRNFRLQQPRLMH